jgi:hypothetical protein
MSRIVIVILIYHRHKSIDLSLGFCHILSFQLLQENFRISIPNYNEFLQHVVKYYRCDRCKGFKVR